MYILSESFAMFTYAGVWLPLDWDVRCTRSMFYKIYTFFSIALVYTLTVSELVAALLLTKSIDDFSEISFLLISTISVCCKTANIIIRRHRVIGLVDMLLEAHCLPRNLNEIEILQKFNKISRFTALSCIVLAEMTVCAMSMGPLFQSKENRTLPFKSWLPYEIERDSVFWLSYLHQAAAIVACATINVANDSMICGFMLQACSQLELLNRRLYELPKIVNSSANYSSRSVSEAKSITRHIQHHNHIFSRSQVVMSCHQAGLTQEHTTLSSYTKGVTTVHSNDLELADFLIRFAESMSNIFTPVIIVQFCMSSVVLSVSVYQLSVRSNNGIQLITMVLYLCCMLVQFFMYCWFGNEVTLKSKDFGLAIYDIDWTALRLKTSKSLIIMMLRAKRPIVMSCGSIITLSIKSFTSILKASYSAFNVLQRSTETYL